MDAYQDDRDRRRSRKPAKSATTGTKGTGLPTAARNEQLNAFGPEPGAANVGPATRTSDPSTSHAAAKRAARGLTTKQIAVLDTFQRVRAARQGLRPVEITHEELIESYAVQRTKSAHCAWYPALTDSSIRTRCKELATLSYIYRYDEEGTTRTGGRAARWKLTHAGERADTRALRFDRAAHSKP